MNQQLIEFLDKYGLQGTYSGGGDSGGIDKFGTEREIEEADKNKFSIDHLQEWVYKHTLSEYGGWAWNGDASGDISYNKEEKKIIVDGSETDDDNVTEVHSEKLSLKEFFTQEDAARVDSVNFYLSEYDDARVRVNVLNGPWTESLQKAEDTILAKLEEINRKWKGGDHKFWLDDAYEINEEITISIGVPSSDDKHWEIDLTEMEYNEKEVLYDY